MNDPGTFRDWMNRVDIDLKRMEDKWQRSVDDIKSIIKSEIADLKSEQIMDLKNEVHTLEQRVDGQNMLISDMRTKQESWDAGAGILGWIIKTLIGIGGALAGAFGWEHIRH